MHQGFHNHHLPIERKNDIKTNMFPEPFVATKSENILRTLCHMNCTSPDQVFPNDLTRLSGITSLPPRYCVVKAKISLSCPYNTDTPFVLLCCDGFEVLPLITRGGGFQMYDKNKRLLVCVCVCVWV